MNKLTFLTYSQSFYIDNTVRFFDSDTLNIIRKIGPLAAITDFSILLGDSVSNDRFTNEGKELKYRLGKYWTKTNYADTTALIVGTAHYPGFFDNIAYRKIGGRPVLQYSLISDIVLSKINRPDGILEIEYGEYPQWVPSYDYQFELKNAYKNGTIKKLDSHITTDSRKPDEYDKDFEPQEHQIYEYKGKKYTRVKANTLDNIFKLSDGLIHNRDDYVWVEISPVKWLVDEDADIAISKNILFAGVQFKHNRNYNGDFSKTDINMFMNTYLIKDLFKCNSIINKTSNSTNEELLEEIKVLREKLEIANQRNNELTKENTSYKQRIRRIQDITKE